SVSSNWRNPNRRAAIRGDALGSFRRRSGRWRRRRPDGRAAANAVAERLARERRLAAGSRVVEGQLLEFVVARRLDGEIAVGRAVGRLEDLFHDPPGFEEEAEVFDRLDRRPAPVARVEEKRGFTLEPVAAVATVFQAKGAALELMHALRSEERR